MGLGMPPKDLERNTCRQILRYLKRGAFPPFGIDRLTVGREVEISLLQAGLSRAQQGSSTHLFLEGDYGHGKSHMLRYTEAMALAQGFAVTWIVLDGYARAMNHPARYLHSLFENMRVADLPFRGLGCLVDHWLKTDRRDAILQWVDRQAPWELGYSVNSLSHGASTEWYRDGHVARMEARDIQHRAGRSQHEIAYKRINGVTALCRAAGIQGVVYLFDELETVATLLWNVRSRMLSYEVLNTLTDGRRFSNSMFVFSATPEFGYRVHRDGYEASYYSDEYAAGARFVGKWTRDQLSRRTLHRIDARNNETLFKTLRDLHSTAYSWTAASRVSDKLIHAFCQQCKARAQTERESVRDFTTILETAEQHRSCRIAETLDLEADQSLHGTSIDETLTEAASSPLWYFKDSGSEMFGPVSMDDLVALAADCRIGPEHEVSSDQDEWVPASTLPALQMEWAVWVAGKLFGPLHVLAAKKLFEKGNVEPSSKIVNITTGECRTARDLFARRGS